MPRSRWSAGDCLCQLDGNDPSRGLGDQCGQLLAGGNGAALPIATVEESALPELALPQIVDSLQEARVVGDGPFAIDPQVLTSALTLMAAMPELEGGSAITTQ